MRVLVIGLLLVTLFGGAVTPIADAAPSRKKAIWGPVVRDGKSQFPIYRDLGVGLYQTTLSWSAIASARPATPRDPADPAYRWPADVDLAAAQAPGHGMSVSLLVTSTPRWANGGRDARWTPNDPKDYADFLEAAARRYPGVRHWMIWGEPSKESNFQPLQSDRKGPLRGSGARGPRLYAQLLDEAYGRLKALNRANLVIGGNTYTVGTVRPLNFIRAMRLPNGRAPRMDLYGHNPFSLRRPDLRASPLGNGFADFGDLDTLARWLDRYRVGRGKKLRLFLSEYSLPTDRRNREFNFFVTRRTQASWISSALRVARGWKRIYTFGYLGLYDEQPNAQRDEIRWGLLDANGRRKPAFDAFRRG
ncbi:MAG: hypothetical protein AVDCRST_MAG85-1256 [uncultured Solirubrobacteraceae bacterium]|uniref:GH39 n=1 Tax=uncultured Solirubrobacteraceae bacterium TaxID=1162706 RepID=A0A6J4SBX5_9ACTN|nr:MAG: hypothetical protein AVDCRST_MAG85-1256 [uncultured Solirubrobacteraceae bacterium]